MIQLGRVCGWLTPTTYIQLAGAGSKVHIFSDKAGGFLQLTIECNCDNLLTSERIHQGTTKTTIVKCARKTISSCKFRFSFSSTMETSRIFDTVLNTIENSKINYFISKTPFSAQISIKNTLINPLLQLFMSRNIWNRIQLTHH